MPTITPLFLAWLSSLRPKTLPLASMSIFLGTSLAYYHGSFSLSIMALAWLTASCLQILSNLANDYGDALKNTDRADRLGPLRGIHTGLISTRQLYVAMIYLIIITIVLGSILLWQSISNWQSLLVFLLLGLLSIVAAIAYTVGKKPYGYRALGDIAVFIFFGLLAVLGTIFLQTQTYYPIDTLPAMAMGLLAVAVLNINNIRDMATDPLSGKVTLAQKLGPRGSRYYHVALLLGAWLFFAAYAVTEQLYPLIWVGILPFFMWQIRAILQQQNVAALLLPTIRLSFFCPLCLIIGIGLHP